MRDPYINATTTYALARHADFLAEAARERRLALAVPARTSRPSLGALLRQAVAGLGARRVLPSTPTTASAAC